MAGRNVDLINAAAGVYDTSEYTFDSVADTAARNGRGAVRLQRLQGGVSDGVDLVRFDNGRMELDVLPTRGMGIWQGQVDGIRLGWDSPAERPVHPAWVDSMRRGGIGWLDGFNEFICRCGLGWHGAPGNDVRRNDQGEVVSEEFLPLHGRIANLPAHQVTLTIDGDDMVLTGVVDEASLFGGRLRLISQLRTCRGSLFFQITDTVVNRGSATAEVEMLYHCNIGRPFLEAGSEFFGVSAEIAPRDPRAAQGIDTWTRFDAPEPGFAEQVFFTRALADGHGFGLAVLVNAARTLAVAIRFRTATLPWFVLWKNTQAEEDGFVTGLEPASSFPNLRTFERQQGRVILLEPGDSVQFDVRAEIAVDPGHVASLIDEVAARQQEWPPALSTQPRTDWSPSEAF